MVGGDAKAVKEEISRLKKRIRDAHETITGEFGSGDCDCDICKEVDSVQQPVSDDSKGFRFNLLMDNIECPCGGELRMSRPADREVHTFYCAKCQTGCVVINANIRAHLQDLVRSIMIEGNEKR